MPRPICFMIMPYSTKPTGTLSGTEGPNKETLTASGLRPLRPAIDEAGYEPIRANEDTDLVLADVSSLNGNVYYEVDVRHAAA